MDGSDSFTISLKINEGLVNSNGTDSKKNVQFPHASEGMSYALGLSYCTVKST